MKILVDTSLAQTLSIIPRKYPTSVNYTLTEEGTRREVVKTGIATQTVSGFLTLSDTFLLSENKFYSLDVFDNSDDTLIFRDKIFCTNQSVEDYTINKDEYIEDGTYDNSYIIYGEDITPPATMTLTSAEIE